MGKHLLIAACKAVQEDVHVCLPLSSRALGRRAHARVARLLTP